MGSSKKMCLKTFGLCEETKENALLNPTTLINFADDIYLKPETNEEVKTNTVDLLTDSGVLVEYFDLDTVKIVRNPYIMGLATHFIGKVSKIDLSQENDHNVFAHKSYGAKYTGFFTAPTTGSIDLCLKSSDGSL